MNPNQKCEKPKAKYSKPKFTPWFKESIIHYPYTSIFTKGQQLEYKLEKLNFHLFEDSTV